MYVINNTTVSENLVYNFATQCFDKILTQLSVEKGINQWT